MPSRSFDLHTVDDLARSQGGILTHGQLVALGMSPTSISRWTRTGGRWQRLLPATYLVHRGTPTLTERFHAAVQYAGPGGVLSSLGALHLYGFRNLPFTPEDLPVLLLIDAGQRLRSASFVTVERTRRMPSPVLVDGFPVAPLARAVFDAGRRTAGRQAIRAFTLEAVQRHGLDIDDLRREVRDGPRQWTALLRDVIGEASAGVRSVPEAELRTLVVGSDLPEPLWNPRLETLDGELVAEPDGYYEDIGLALEVDSRRHHFEEEAGYEQTWSRHSRFARLGIAVIRIMPVDIRRQPADVLTAIADARQAHEGRVPPLIKVIPRARSGRLQRP